MKVNLVNDSKNAQSYRILLEGIFCSLLIFNRRRVGELQRMTLSCYLQNHDKVTSQEFEKVLTESEKVLYKSLKRIVIRGKRGKGVPVLFERHVSESIDFAISIRNNFDLQENIYLFGLPGTTNPLSGNVVMRKYAKLAFNDINKASLLTSTKLRKHLATIVQILHMEKSELEQLATFLGHTEKTHSDFYRLPSDIYQTAKVSKILLLSKKNCIERFKGQRLADLNIDDDIFEANEEEESENEIDLENTEEVGALQKTLSSENVARAENLSEKQNPAVTVEKSALKIKKGPKRVLVPWTNEQKKIAEGFFKYHIKNKKIPKKDEVTTLTNNNPGVFDNKSWQVIKIYVVNKFTKK